MQRASSLKQYTLSFAHLHGVYATAVTVLHDLASLRRPGTLEPPTAYVPMLDRDGLMVEVKLHHDSGLLCTSPAGFFLAK